MILSTVSFRIAPGHNADANAYLRQVMAHLKSVTGSDYRLYTRMGGPVGHVVLGVELANMTEWEAARGKIMADPTFLKMADDSGKAGHFIAGSVEQSIWHFD